MSVRHIDDLPPDVSAALRRVPRWEPDTGVRHYCACGHSDRLHVETAHGPGCAGRSVSPGGGPCGCSGLRVVYEAPTGGWSPEKDALWSREALRRAGGR